MPSTASTISAPCTFFGNWPRLSTGRVKRLVAGSTLLPKASLNDVRVINPPESGGYGLDAQWNDDFHHALWALLTGERTGYYSDFGQFSDLVKSFSEGFVLSGELFSLQKTATWQFLGRYPPCQLVVFFQNHDQVGNRMRGERPGEHLSMQQLKLVAATVLLSPYVPLLFMGEEYAESAPFPYFVSHGDAQLVEAVRRGRLEEFAAFAQKGSPPDPQSEATFLSAKVDQEQRHRGEHRAIFDFYRELIRLRQEYAPLARLSREDMQIDCLRRGTGTGRQPKCRKCPAALPVQLQ